MRKIDKHALYFEAIKKARYIINVKSKQYGLSWLLYDRSTIVKELEKKIDRVSMAISGVVFAVDETMDEMVIAVINYSAMLIYISENPNLSKSSIDDIRRMNNKNVVDGLSKVFDATEELYKRKNTDYSAAWHSYSVQNLTDYCRIRIFRLGTITMDSNLTDTEIDDMLIDNAYDLVNYASFLYANVLGIQKIKEQLNKKTDINNNFEKKISTTGGAIINSSSNTTTKFATK